MLELKEIMSEDQMSACNYVGICPDMSSNIEDVMLLLQSHLLQHVLERKSRLYVVCHDIASNTGDDGGNSRTNQVRRD